MSESSGFDYGFLFTFRTLLRYFMARDFRVHGTQLTAEASRGSDDTVATFIYVYTAAFIYGNERLPNFRGITCSVFLADVCRQMT